MAEIKGTNLASPITPFSTEDNYPTHYSEYGKGGHKEVTTYKDLLAIPVDRLTIGTVCYVAEQGVEYRCIKIEAGKSTWEQLATEFVVSDKEPVGNKDKIWFDTGDNGNLDTRNDEQLNSVNRAITKLQQQMTQVLKLLNYGVVSGDSTVSWKNSMISQSQHIINPNTGEIETDSDGNPKPVTSGLEYTVPNISIKRDTAANFSKNFRNLIDGELIWITDQGETGSLFIYIDGQFKQVATGGGGSVNPDDDNMTAEEIKSLIESGVDFDSLNFIDLASNKYKARINESGNLIIYNGNSTSLGSVVTGKVYISQLLNISSVFCGGSGDKYSYQSCSHNFVELANGSTNDINLNGLVLMYQAAGTSKWEWLPLVGTIKAGSTFLIRGKQCSVKTNTTIIEVGTPDMEWYAGNDKYGKITSTNLISFNQAGGTFYLAWCTRTNDNTIQIYADDSNLTDIDKFTSSTPYRSGTAIVGYVDSVGIGSGAGEGSTTITISAGHDASNCLYKRWYYLDPSNQANKEYSSRKTSSLWTYIDLATKNQESNSLKTYFSEKFKVKQAPHASSDHANLFTQATTFDPGKPNYVNITFGRQATYGGTNKTATRCFNWISVGYYDEFLEYKKSTDTSWKKLHSITESSVATGGEFAGDEGVKKYIKQYSRIRWIATSGTSVTTHKVILHGLTNGTYQYRVGRDSDSSYLSDTMEFTVYSDDAVKNFSFVQVTDQQGFNWIEYVAWKKSADYIGTKENDILFTVNTGDITQNGNRENEWLDYYDGRKSLRNKEEMFTIGNNDLCGAQEYLLGNGEAARYKISHINILFYYTYEIDPNNSAIFTYTTEKDTFTEANTTRYIDSLVNKGEVSYRGFSFYMPSLYSFNFGDYHFVSINSEFKDETATVYTSATGLSGFLSQILSQTEEWLRKDLLLWKGTTVSDSAQPSDCSKAVIFCHEMPFTIVTVATYTKMSTGSVTRGGSKLNNKSSKTEGGASYRFSRLFKKYGIRLVIGGHKHTYSISKPIYDASSSYLVNNKPASGVDIMSREVTDADSGKPIIQVTSLPSNASSETNARYELVSKINAPIYVMSQATGYKLVSNQEIPSSTNITWLQKYFPGVASAAGAKDKEGIAQHKPTYVRYDMTSSGITVTSYQINGIWNVDMGAGKTTYYWNNWVNSTDNSSLPTIERQAIDLGDGLGTSYKITF